LMYVVHFSAAVYCSVETQGLERGEDKQELPSRYRARTTPDMAVTWQMQQRQAE